MNFRICISLFLLCCLLQPSTAQQPVTKPKEVTVKAMTYNTYSGRKQGIDKIAEVIKKENPDIVSLQEIERNTEINPWDTPRKLSELTGMKYYYFAHALDIPTGGDYGNVILSKYPVSEEKSFKLSVLKEGDYVTAGDVIGYMGHTGYSDTENVNNIETVHLHVGLQLIFDESQKDGNNEIWVDFYQLAGFLSANRCEVERDESTKEWDRKYRMKDPSVPKEPDAMNNAQ